MYRFAMEELKTWKNSRSRKPLILRGARQVGKTWLLRHFGEENYANVVYLNMEDEQDIAAVFEQNLDPHRIIRTLENAKQIKITPGETLLIFDEIQAVPRALTALKYFCENASEYHVAVAGSLLGVALHQGTSFPVGKVDFIDIYPMNFAEFLYAVGKENLAQLIQGSQYDADLKVLHPELINQLKNYFIVGGMPEAVQNFVDGLDFATVRATQKRIIDAYELDFSKHAPHTEYPRIREIYNAIPDCLTRENKKFLFSAIRDSARSREYEMALLWVEDTGIAAKVTRVNAAKLPLKVYENRNIFKLFMSDIGLLGAKITLDPRVILDSNNLFVEYKGALAEQFVFQELLAAGVKAHYFSNDDSRGEIDFIIDAGTTVLPIEVKAGENLNSISLNNFVAKWGLKKAVKLSILPFQENETIDNLPLYLVGNLKKYYEAD